MAEIEDTRHIETTPYGIRTPHKFPGAPPPNDFTIFRELSMQLYPTGRAWYRKERGTWDNFHEAINVSFLILIQSALSLLDSTFPDNENFSVDDAILWEYRLGLITNNDVDLELRKLALLRKLAHPNNVKARQHPLFIQSQLQAAGFNVFVHENTIPYRTPDDVATVVLPLLEHGEPTQHGEATQHGSGSFDVIANSIEEFENYAVGGEDNLWATFFICGEILGSNTTVPRSRLKEFKELVIKLKPAHTVAFTFINYI